MPKKATSSVPLHCSLCPKNPQFSDISHLLTHISSKSHLSHRFKLQIRSQSEISARQQLDDFERWYAVNGLEDLLSERMAAKDQKKKSNKRARASAGTAKDEDQPINLLDPTPHYQAPVPRMHTWSTAPSLVPQSPLSHSEADDNNVYSTPTAKRHLPNFSKDGDSISRRTRGALAKALTPSKSFHIDNENSDAFDPADQRALKPEKSQKVPDNAKLKGIYWPGMDLFDSATAEMKRNRNQKKDGSVLRRMIHNSTEVEPNEWIFDSDGDIFKIRSLYDPDTESDFLGSDAETPSRKTSHYQKRLDDRDEKCITHELGTRIIKTNAHREIKIENQLEYHISLDNPLASRRSNRYEPSSEEDEEFRLTLEDMNKKKSFGIFRDVSPGRTESPLEETKFDLPAINQPLQPVSTNDSLQYSYSAAFKPMSVYSNEQGGPRMRQGLHRNSSVAGGFPPQVFHDHTFNPLMLHSHAHTFSYGDENVFPFSSFGGDLKPMTARSAVRELPCGPTSSENQSHQKSDVSSRHHK